MLLLLLLLLLLLSLLLQLLLLLLLFLQTFFSFIFLPGSISQEDPSSNETATVTVEECVEYEVMATSSVTGSDKIDVGNVPSTRGNNSTRLLTPLPPSSPPSPESMLWIRLLTYLPECVAALANTSVYGRCFAEDLESGLLVAGKNAASRKCRVLLFTLAFPEEPFELRFPDDLVLVPYVWWRDTPEQRHRYKTETKKAIFHSDRGDINFFLYKTIII